MRLGGVLMMALGLRAMSTEPSAGDSTGRSSFAPPGWEVGDCPKSYGPDAVLCAGTDTGRWKVDRHIPTLVVEAPATSCAEAEKGLVSRMAGLGPLGLAIARRSVGTCGPDRSSCTELRFKDARPTDPVGGISYIVCPARGPVEVVSYGVSARVLDDFEAVARGLARWRPAARTSP